MRRRGLAIFALCFGGGCSWAAKACGVDVERYDRVRREIERDRGAAESKFRGLGLQIDDGAFGLMVLADHDEETRCAAPESERIKIDRRLLEYTDFDPKTIAGSAFPSHLEELAAARARAAIRLRDLELAETIGRCLLHAAVNDSQRWNRGSLQHRAQQIFADVAFARGDLDGAAKMLVAAAEAPVSRQLEIFGPDFFVAADLLAAGKKDPVLRYLSRVKEYWRPSTVAKWIEKISRGETPDDGEWRLKTERPGDCR